MAEPLVSIIIPVYNAASYLENCIKSALNQTWVNKEIIIVNDGSTDTSLTIAEKYRSERVKILSQKNKGAASARNIGIIHSEGEFIQFLDADDLLSANKIKNQVMLLINEPDKLAVCSTVHFPDDEDHSAFLPDKYEEQFLYHCDNPVYFLTKLWGGFDGKGAMIQPNAWLVPRNVLLKTGGWDEQLSLDDDGEFFCRIILNSAGIIRDEESLNYYRKHRGSKSLSGKHSEKALKSILQAVKLKKIHLLTRLDTPDTRTAIANQYFSICLMCYDKHKEIYSVAKNGLKNLNVNAKHKPVIGGKAIQLIVSLFGWKTAKIISNLKQKYFEST